MRSELQPIRAFIQVATTEEANQHCGTALAASHNLSIKAFAFLSGRSALTQLSGAGGSSELQFLPVLAEFSDCGRFLPIRVSLALASLAAIASAGDRGPAPQYEDWYC